MMSDRPHCHLICCAQQHLALVRHSHFRRLLRSHCLVLVRVGGLSQHPPTSSCCISVALDDLSLAGGMQPSQGFSLPGLGDVSDKAEFKRQVLVLHSLGYLLAVYFYLQLVRSVIAVLTGPHRWTAWILAHFQSRSDSLEQIEQITLLETVKVSDDSTCWPAAS